MDIHFNHTEPVQAPAEVLFDVITDYTSYPSFNPALIKVEVVAKDQSGAEFLADRKTKIAKQVRAFDRYQRNGDLVVERTYDGNESAHSTWTVHAHHRRIPAHGPSTRPGDEARPQAPVLQHQLHPVHRRGRAAREL